MSHFYLLQVFHWGRKNMKCSWGITWCNIFYAFCYSMHQLSSYNIFSLQSSTKPYTRLRTYNSYNYTNNHNIDINKLTTSCIYLCTYIYACMLLPLLTKSMWLCKRNYLIDRFMYLLWELYYHKMAQMMCLFVEKSYRSYNVFNVLICNCKRE